MDDTTKIELPEGDSSKKSKRVRIAIACIVAAIVLWCVAALAQGPVASMVNTGDASDILSSSESSAGSHDGWGGSGGSDGYGSSGSSIFSNGSSSSSPSSSATNGNDAAVSDPIVARKVDRGAELGIVANDFERATVALDELLATANARIESDETTQYGRTEKNAGYLSRVIYAKVPSDGLNDLIAAISDNAYLEISSRRVSMRDVTEDYTEIKGKVDDLDAQIAETQDKLGQDGLTEAEKSRLEDEAKRLEEHRESANMQLENLEQIVDSAEVSIVLQGRAKKASGSVTQKQQELNDKLAETPVVFANICMTIIIFLLTVLPYIIILGVVGLAAWFVYGKVSATRTNRDADSDR